MRVKYVDVDLLPRVKKPWWFGYGASDAAVPRKAFLDFQFARKMWRRLIGGMRSLPLISRRKL